MIHGILGGPFARAFLFGFVQDMIYQFAIAKFIWLGENGSSDFYQE